MSESAMQELPVGDNNTPISPFVMKQINDIHNRLHLQRQTSQEMWKKLKPSVDLAEWIQKTYPELMEQFAAIKDLERLSGDRIGVGGFARPEVKAEGEEVRYGNI